MCAKEMWMQVSPQPPPPHTHTLHSPAFFIALPSSLFYSFEGLWQLI